jgi:hypothetical protein
VLAAPSEEETIYHNNPDSVSLPLMSKSKGEFKSHFFNKILAKNPVFVEQLKNKIKLNQVNLEY